MVAQVRREVADAHHAMSINYLVNDIYVKEFSFWLLDLINCIIPYLDCSMKFELFSIIFSVPKSFDLEPELCFLSAFQWFSPEENTVYTISRKLNFIDKEMSKSVNSEKRDIICGLEFVKRCSAIVRGEDLILFEELNKKGCRALKVFSLLSRKPWSDGQRDRQRCQDGTAWRGNCHLLVDGRLQIQVVPVRGNIAAPPESVDRALEDPLELSHLIKLEVQPFARNRVENCGTLVHYGRWALDDALDAVEERYRIRRLQ